MQCKVRSYQLIPDLQNPGKPLKVDNNMNNIIYDETMYFPIKYQKAVRDAIETILRCFKQISDQEKALNVMIIKMKKMYGLTTFKPMFPKENLGVLIGDPFFNFY